MKTNLSLSYQTIAVVVMFTIIYFLRGYFFPFFTNGLFVVTDRLPQYAGCNHIANLHQDLLARRAGVTELAAIEDAAVRDEAIQLNSALLELCNTEPSINALKSSQTYLADDMMLRKNRIEEAFPEFLHYGTPQDESFAGTEVVTKVAGNDYYFAYITNGSGLPIAAASCFRVDAQMRVFKVGEFPDYTDSYSGYRTVDPVTCQGIKP